MRSKKDTKNKADSIEKELATLKEDSRKKELVGSGLIEKQKADSLSLDDAQAFILENNGFTKDEIAKMDGRGVDGAIAVLIKTASNDHKKDGSEYDRQVDQLNQSYNVQDHQDSSLFEMNDKNTLQDFYDQRANTAWR